MKHLLWVLALAAAGWAQTQSRLTGTVTDNTGAVVVGAAVVARNVATGVTFPATTNQTGTYAIPFLPPGEYELTCEFTGFKKFSQAGLVLETGFSRNIDIRLEVGAITETVSVTAATPLLETTNSTVGQFIERATVFNMPLESRRTASLVRLMGAVVFRNEGAGEQIPYFSMAGGRSQNQMWQLDGGVVQNMALGIAQLSLNPPSESLQEFKAESNNYSAEFGRTAGGLIIMTTRSGTNAFHGSAYEFLRNQRLDTRTFFARSKAPLRYNIFGASLGGPVRKDRTFFFLNYEGSRRRDGVTVSNTIVPHPAEVSGDFSRRADLRVMDPTTRTPFANNIIPASRIDRLGQALARLYPAPNVSSDATRPPSNNYVVDLSDTQTQDYGTARVDHTFGPNDRIFGRYSNVHAPQGITPVYPNQFADSRGGPRSNSHTNIMGSWVHNFTPNVINEARYMFGNRLHINRDLGAGSGKNGELAIPGVNPESFTQVSLTGLTGLGTGTHERVQTPIRTQQFSDSVTWLRGKHQIKTGFEFRFSRNKDDFNAATGGRFTFGDRATGSGLATLLLGWTTSGELIDTDILNSRTDFYGAFIQDDWKVTPRLTLNLGLRWDLDTPRWEKEDNRQSGFDPNQTNPVSGTPGIVTFSGRDGVSKYAHDFDTNNYGPRFGFAYRAPGELVIRGGYGISYNGEYARAVPFSLFHGFSLSGSFQSPDGGFTPAFLLRDGMPRVTREPLGPGFGAVRVGQAARLAPDFFQKDHVNGYAQQWNLTVQKETRFNMLFEVAYLANVGHQLGGDDLNINMIPLVNGRGPAQQDQRLRPFPQFTNVVRKSPPWGNSTYHAMNVKLEKRYSRGLNFLMNYTWSKFLDDVEASSELGGEQGNGYTHLQLRGLDKSLSGSDVRHRYIASMVYELPFGRGKAVGIQNPVLNHVAGGWGLGLITEFRGGAPYGAIEQTNVTNTFSAAQRPNLVRDPKLTGERPRAEMLGQYFDTSAFQAPGVGIFGNAPRNQGIGPGLISVDLAVHKRWTIVERYNLQFRSDFFNLPNVPSFANPNLLRGRGDFGRITSTLLGSTGRQIQLSLRLEF